MSDIKKQHFKYACVYTDGGMRTLGGVPGAGAGVHGYYFNELESMRYAGVPHLITIEGYKPKLTGPQLKDKKHQITCEAWGVTQKLRDDKGDTCKVLKESNVVVVDGYHGIKDQPTNNRGEMQAIIDLINECPITADKYIIKADSMLTINGFNTDMAKWKERDWRTSNGQEVKNQDLWLTLDAIRETRVDDISLSYIKAHAGHYGNEMADRNATHGVCSAVNGDTEMHWVISDLNDSEYWDPSKPIPPIMRTKWCYGLTGKERRTMNIDGIDHHHYFCGDHSKDADDANLLGKEISDAGFCLIYHNEPIDVVDRLIKYHTSNMWDNDCIMYQSDVINMVHLANLNTPKELWRQNNVKLEALIFKSHCNDLVSSDEKLLSMMIRPPLLSYRCLEIESELHTVMYSALQKLGRKTDNPRELVAMKNIVLNDVTDLFYKREMKKDGTAGALKLTNFYDQVNKALTFKVAQPCSDKIVKLILTRGIDMPTRNTMSALAAENPRVHIVTWKFSKISFRYGLLVETDNSVGFWDGYYSCRRDLDECDM